MRIITKRDRIKGVLESWKEQYPRGSGVEWDKTTDELFKLNLNKVSEKKITEIIGNNSWTRLECGECGKDGDKVIRFLEKYEDDYEANSADICCDCLKDALRKIKLRSKDGK